MRGKYLSLSIMFIILLALPINIRAGQDAVDADAFLELSAADYILKDDRSSGSMSDNSETAELCPGNALFGQQIHLPTDAWNAATSDAGAVGSIRVYDNHDAVGLINRVCFWGINGYYTDQWFICYESPMTFNIKFYTDNGGAPGSEIATYTSSSVGYKTDLVFGFAFELYKYNVDLDPPLEIENGWISIQGMGSSSVCWFVWMSAASGMDQISYQWDGSNFNLKNFDRAFCLQQQAFVCGDIDGDGSVNLFDVIYYIYYKYRGGPAPDSVLTADPNRDGAYNILDIVYLLNFLYKDGPTPVCP